MHRHLKIHFIAVAISGCLAISSAFSQDEEAKTFSSRFLSLFSTTIVEVQPSTQGKTLPESWTVIRVLHQDQSSKLKVKKGQRLSFQGKKLDSEFKLKNCLLERTHFRIEYKNQLPWLRDSKTSYVPTNIKSAILYIVNVSGTDAKPIVTCQRGGIRLLMEDGSVLAPLFEGHVSDKPICRFVPLNQSWKWLLSESVANAPQAESFRKICQIKDKRKRAVQLVQWLEIHKKEFVCVFGLKCTGFEENRDVGWYGLENLVPHLIDETKQHEQVWKAIVIANQNPPTPTSSRTTFGESVGRRWLFDNVLTRDANPSVLQLGLSTLLRSGSIGFSENNVLSPDYRERLSILEILIPFLEHKTPAVRLAAMRCVKKVSVPHISLQQKHSKIKTALSQVVQVFKRETVPAIRREMIDYLLALVDEAEWHKLSGNPSLMTAIFWSASVMPESCHLRLDVRCPIGKVECDGFPEIVCQRIKNGRPVETKTLQPKFVDIPTGYPTCYDHTRLTAALSRKDLSNGLWRFRAVGKLKNGKVWKSEQFEFAIESAHASFINL